jgi:16S rRNA C967 or C1407 C5-methylase (RsmB/RsmF family)/NOL1/NOP2/fmu family ribosome biogenesis protein
VPSRLPKEFLSSLEGLPGYDAAAFEAVHASGDQVTSVRLNPAKPVADLFKDAAPVPWSSHGRYLETRPSFVFDPLFHAGAYYVQEASSMFVEQALKQTVELIRPLRVLDLCAAPGGKSTLLQSLLSPDSLLVSNEVIRNRANVLEENMIKWGGVNVVVTSNDPRAFARLENYFDVIVADAPCSGSGLFRREPDALGEWSPANVQLCSRRQQGILADCWPALRHDGVMIYSTCSYSREEDEDVLDWLTTHLDATACRLDIASEWDLVETRTDKDAWGYRFYPDKVKGEGFFIGCLRKKGGGEWSPPRKVSLPSRPDKKEQELVSAWVRSAEPLFFFKLQQQLFALPQTLAAELPVLQTACYLRKAGLMLGQVSPRELIPSHDLAMSTLVSPDLPVIGLSKDEALRYLRKDDLHPEGAKNGWTLMRYEGLNLGWMKVLSNRSNNYYPMEWRILKRAPSQ